MHSITDALLEYHVRHGQNSARKDITQEMQSNTLKAFPLLFYSRSNIST